MSRARHLLSHINLLNIILTGILIFLVGYKLLPLLNKDNQYAPPVAVKQEKPEFGAENRADLTKTPSPFDFVTITEQNVFHPERKIPLTATEAQAVPKADFVLYGTLISDTLKLAFMDDLKSPQSTPGRGKRQHTVSQGKSLSGYMLTEVFTDRVVMVRGEERIEVSVKDPSKPKRVKKS
ncbi:MAG: hypothetical protein HZB62_06885 [Nitrospirae bacterium]|nr:hypothetical protein [Nitrospirota bacterium]